MSGDFLLARAGTKLDYGFDWTDWLAGASIANSEWAVGPSGPTLSGGSVPGNTTIIFAEFSAAHAEKTYVLQNTVTDDIGATDKRSIVIRCVAAAVPTSVSDYVPGLDFSDARNSQYVALI